MGVDCESYLPIADPRCFLDGSLRRGSFTARLHWVYCLNVLLPESCKMLLEELLLLPVCIKGQSLLK